MKKLLVLLSVLSLAFTAQAELEVQINGAFNDTSGNLTISELGEKDTDVDSNTSWSLGGEVYTRMSEKWQLGGVLGVTDTGVDGADTQFNLGALARYNLGDDIRNAMFVGGGVSFTDVGNADYTSLVASFGKRFSLSETVTYTPNVSLEVPVSGDAEGHEITINFISFSGFLNI